MKIGVISLGCAKNLVDTENLLGMLKFSHQEITTSYEEADAIIINTCGFIESAKTEAIDTILEMADLKQRHLQKLIVMGCLAKRYKPQLEKELPEVDRVISIDEYPSLGSILTQTLGVPIANNYGLVPRVLSGKPWMAYLQIADGCDNQCAFCAIPGIRGRLHSRPMEDILSEAERLAANGVKEITLVAQDCSRYGYDFDHQLHLPELLQQLDAIEGIHWIRMLYLYPDEIPDHLIEVMKQCRHIVPYFDIPSQSGSDHVLHAMRRKTSRQKILDLTHDLREAFPHAILRTTLISGFPGETEADHQKTLDMIRQVRFDRLGVFTFSQEENTPAALMVDDVPQEEKMRRRQEILDAQEEIGRALLTERIGRTVEVLVERKDPLTGMYLGRSEEFAPDNVDGTIRFRSAKEYVPGAFVMVKLTRVSGQNLIGEEAA